MPQAKILEFRQVFDLRDDEQLKDLISRVAARLIIVSEGGVSELVANPVAIQMISGYMQFLFDKICEEHGITLDLTTSDDNVDFYNIHKETEH